MSFSLVFFPIKGRCSLGLLTFLQMTKSIAPTTSSHTRSVCLCARRYARWNLASKRGSRNMGLSAIPKSGVPPAASINDVDAQFVRGSRIM